MISIEREKKRQNYVDILKGISIITLIFLHFENGINYNYNYFIIRSPIFYFVIGWLWGLSNKERNISDHLRHRKKTLIYPYLWFSLIIIIFDLLLVIVGLREPSLVYRDTFKFLCLRGIGTLWFLPALLGGEILFIYSKKNILRLISILCCSYICILLYLNNIENLPFNETLNNIIAAPIRFIKDVFTAFMYIFISYYASKKLGANILKSSKISKLAFGTLMLAFLFFTQNILYIHIPKYFFALNFITNCIGYIGLVCIVTLFENSFLLRPITYCGRNSLILMATHFSIILELFYIFDNKIMGYQDFLGYRTIIYFIITMMLEYLIIQYINTKAKFLIGKK